MTRKGIVPQATHSESAVRAGLSTLALILVVVATPVILLKVGGSPLSHIDLSRVSQMFASHRSSDPGLIAHWVVRGALLIAWICWAWMTLCVALEVKARITGRSSTRLPASRTLQSLAACLVGTALALSPIGRVISAPRATGGSGHMSGDASAIPFSVIDEPLPTGHTHRPGVGTVTPEMFVVVRTATPTSVEGRGSAQHHSENRVAVLDAVDLLSSTGSTEPDAADQPGELGRTARPNRVEGQTPRAPSALLVTSHPVQGEHHSAVNTHRVMPRETLWSIAAERLGSALRWRELAQYNYGLPQPDGGTLTQEHWIQTGWTLVLPESVRGLASSGVVAPMSSPGGSEPEPFGGQGWTPDLPVSFPGPARTAIAGRPTTPQAGSVAGGRTHSPLLPFAPGGGGIVGAGVVSLLDRMRRVQQRHRGTGTYIRLPAWSQNLIEQRLRLGDGREVAEAVDTALRLFAEEIGNRGLDSLIVNGVMVRHEVIELAIDSLDSLPGLTDSFTIGPGGRSVLVDRSALPPVRHPRKAAYSATSPAPLLVTAGRGEDGLILVNLESLGRLVVSGDATGCESVVRALALELATSLWAGRFDVILVGFGSEFERFDRVEATSDVPKIIDSLCRRRITAARLLQSAGHASFANARNVDGSDRWDPLVVVCGPTIADDQVAELLELTPDPGLGIAVVAIGQRSDTADAVRLSVPEQSASLEPLSSVVFPQRVGAEDLAAVTCLMESATSRESMFLSEPPYLSLPISMPTPAPDERVDPDTPHGAIRDPQRNPHWAPSDVIGQESSVGDHEIEIAVLGPIEIRGAAREFTRAWAKELVVYLSMHPRGVSNEAWTTALWPDRLMAPSSLHSTASVARRSLGTAANGLDHLPHSHGRLALARTVGTDWDRFVALADSDDTRAWRSALELVRGRPFEGLRSSDWPILEGIAPAIESAVVDLSGRLAGANLSARDARGAEWAARKGLLVSPYDERLYRMLLRAADLAGNPAGVEAVMAELVELVAEDIEPLDSIHPSTMELYRSLTRRRSAINRTR
jgi:DNA-binding SARP family transcriptional activator